MVPWRKQSNLLMIGGGESLHSAQESLRYSQNHEKLQGRTDPATQAISSISVMPLIEEQTTLAE
jgi:hypothetical protein